MVPDPLVLPSCGTVTFRDSAVHFKRAHYRRLAAAVKVDDEGRTSFAARSEQGWAVTDLMAEALIDSWRGDDGWYLQGRPVPGEDPSVLEDLSAADLAAIGKHLVPLAFEILGFTSGTADDEGKGVPPSAASNGSTPTSGSAASTGPATTEVPEDPATSLSAGSPTS